MDNTQQKKQQANSLRKQGLLEEALTIYRELFTSNTRDGYDTAGYLHCLRKLKMYKEAVAVADTCDKAYLNLNWCKNEIIWTYIGSIKTNDENAPLGNVLSVANRIIDLNPDDLQKNSTVLFVLKKAKQFKKWDIASQWVDKIDLSTLDKKPITLQKGNTAWSNYLIWHHYKVNCCFFQKKYKEAIEMINDIRNETIPVSKYFRRLEAAIYEQLGQYETSIEILAELCGKKNADWWVIHQYANVLNVVGNKEEALEKLYLAASFSNKIESIVTLIYDIAILCRDLNKFEESYYHILLFKLIREKRNWPVNTNAEKLLRDMEPFKNSNETLNYKNVLNRCKAYWNRNDAGRVKEHEKVRKALTGYLVHVKEDKPFCFIKTKTDSYFCYKSDIKDEVIDGLRVKFNATPSFDKKKKQESWKAIDIELL